MPNKYLLKFTKTREIEKILLITLFDFLDLNVQQMGVHRLVLVLADLVFAASVSNLT